VEHPTPEYRYGPRAANLVRIAISSFVVLLIAVAARGLVWTSSHQTPAQSTASWIVLALCIAAGIVGLTALWRTKTNA
jgi:membrane protein YdbS with pleckstrin-like domain